MRSYGAAAPLLASDRIVELLLFEFEFTSAVARYNSSEWDIEWDGKTWFRGGGVLSVELPVEDASLSAHQAVITLAAMNPAILSRALSEKVAGRPATIYHVLMNPDTFEIRNVVPDLFGYMSALQITAAGSYA